MKTILAIVSVVISVVASFVIAWTVWQLQIEGRAFYCIDSLPFIPSDGFLTSIDTHESARDRLLPGWTWDKLRRTRQAYQLGFVVIAVAGSALSLRVLRHAHRTELLKNAA